MLTMLGSPRLCCDGVTRRETLTVGALSALGGLFNLPSLLALEASSPRRERPGKAKSVIVLYLLGGAPTQDMFDLKPNAPAEIRGEFKPIATSAPGLQIGELLPQTAKWMHRAALVRTVNHKAGCHNTLPSYTGSEQPVPNITTTSDTYPPSMGSVCEYLKPPRQDLPAYVYMPCYLGWGQAMRQPGPYGGFLGKRFDPLFTECLPYVDDPAKEKAYYDQVLRGEPRLPDSVLGPGMTIDRLNTRRGLLRQLDDARGRLESVPLDGFDRTRQRALSLLTSTRIKNCFDLRRADPRQRDRYGRTLFGSSTLVARRLIEEGVRFVNVTWDCFSDRLKLSIAAWDTHQRNFHLLRDPLLSGLDWTYSALMEDLSRSGILDETLVVVMSDFGRTPRINKDAGRDHWSFCYSVLLAGAGIKGGSVCGASDAHAAFIKDRPVSTGDVCATIYKCLGIDPEMPVYDRSGRPHPVAQGGRPIHEILA